MRRLNRRNSRRAFETMEPHYQILPWADKLKCFYCGLPPSDLDHVPPISWAYAIGSEKLIEEDAPFVKVPCCRECNVLLSNQGYFTLKQRKGYIAAALRQRYSKLREAPEWELWELDKLDGDLKQYVRRQADYRLLIERRIDFAESGC